MRNETRVKTERRERKNNVDDSASRYEMFVVIFEIFIPWKEREIINTFDNIFDRYMMNFDRTKMNRNA